MTDQRPKIAALVADAFQEEEYFFPKVALNEAGYQVEVVSSRKEPVEIYSYFARTGLLDVDRAIAEVQPKDYVGILIPGGAKSPALLAEDPRVTKFVQDVSAQGGVIACICRGSMLAARSKVVAGRRMTGFTLLPEGGRTRTSRSNTNVVEPRCRRIIGKHKATLKLHASKQPLCRNLRP
jgi:putative intracellular protease/amidase